ncbi:MAG: 50S ribosomal protein L4 [Candidatus Asgardarchaeia archaeon]
MREVKVYGLDGNVAGSINLPPSFEMPFRPDLIRRVVVAIEANSKQAKGVDPMAGKRTTASSWGPGHGVARVPRVKGSRYSAAGRGAFAPMTVGGRRAHAPTSEKNIKKKVNRKEKKLALMSAIAASANPELVKSRGHLFGELELPIVVVGEIEELTRTKDVVSLFDRIGLSEELERVSSRKKIRAGVGKRRGRKYKVPKGPLIVTSKNAPIYKAARNILGVDVVEVKNLNVAHLAPGGLAGRLTLWSLPAISTLDVLMR